MFDILTLSTRRNVEIKIIIVFLIIFFNACIVVFMRMG